MKIKLKLYTWLTTLFLCVFSIPRNADALGRFITVQNVLEILGVFWTLLLCVKVKGLIKKELFPVLLPLIWFVICTFINRKGYVSVIALCYRLFCITLLCEYLIRKNAAYTIKIIAGLWAILMILQVFSYFTHCFGTVSIAQNMGRAEEMYLFGMKVEINQYIIYSFAFNAIAAYIGGVKEKIYALITFCSAIVFIFALRCSTAIMGLLIFLTVLFFSKIISSKCIWKYLVLFVACFSCFFGFWGNSEWFRWLLENLLHEDITLNGRTILWKLTLEQMKGWHWIFGFGNSPGHILHLTNYFSADHPHNQYLQFLFNYGIPGFLMYIYIWYIQIKQIRIINDFKIRKIYISAVVANMVMCMVSRNYWYGTAQIFFVLSMHIKELTRLNKLRREMG